MTDKTERLTCPICGNSPPTPLCGYDADPIRTAAASAEPVDWQFKRSDGKWVSLNMASKPEGAKPDVEYRPVYTHPTPDAEIVAALDGIDADYMTSETHHPGYVLIPTAKFDALCAAMKTARAAIWNGCDTVKAVAEIDAALAKAKGGSRT